MLFEENRKHFFWHFIHKVSIFFRFRYNDGTVKLRNPNIELMDQDILYHLALGSGSHDLEEMFGDVKVSLRGLNWWKGLQVSCGELYKACFEGFITRSFLFKTWLASISLHHVLKVKLTLNPAVRLHGWNAEAHGKLCTLHHGRNLLQTPGRHAVAGHQRVLLPLLNVQGNFVCNIQLHFNDKMTGTKFSFYKNLSEIFRRSFSDKFSALIE